MDTYDFLADPRNLTLPERHASREQHAQEQAHWLAQLRNLAEEAQPEDDFPAFLLATEPFGELAGRLRIANKRSDLPAAVADELDWFLRAFEGYLRTRDGEDVFEEPRRLTG